MIDNLFQAGEPMEHRGIVIVPLFPARDPIAAYLTLDEAIALGFRISELDGAAMVPEVLVDNPLGDDVLLYDGEELVGAKQNRILNISMLVPAMSRLPIPVSCVEVGRWRDVSASFESAPQTAHPRLRRRKAMALRAEPLARGSAQADVWEEVAETANRLGVRSPSGANADSFRAHRPRLSELERAFPLQPGQCGAVLALGGDICLDAVSRPNAFEQLWPKLRAGYLLDALVRLDGSPADSDEVTRFLDAVGSADVVRRPSAGRGTDLRSATPVAVASGLELDDELIQISAFSSDAARRGRIARPSTRRH